MERYECIPKDCSITISPPKIHLKKFKKPLLFSQVRCLSKKFMYDPSVFNYSDPYEPNRGPGTYNLPPLIGNIQKKQSSMSKSPQRLTPYTSSPGVCYYNPNTGIIFRRSPHFAEQKEPRFKWQVNINKVHIPLSYSKDITTRLRRHGVIFIIKIGKVS